MTWRSNDRDHRGIVNTDKLEWSDTELDKLRKRPFSLTGEIHVTLINQGIRVHSTIPYMMS